MNQQPRAHPDYESLKSIWNSIAECVVNYRHARGTCNDLASCGRDEMERIARDHNRPERVDDDGEKGPHAADLVKKLLVALGIDADSLSATIRLPCEISSGCAQFAPIKNNVSLTLPTALSAIIFVTTARMLLHLTHS